MNQSVAIRPTTDLWSTAVPDWADRVRTGRSLIPDLPLHEAYADKALAIFCSLVVPDIEGMPTHGEVCEQWVFDWVRAIFGSYDPETKVRHLREFFMLVPKKNGKTSIAAAVIVTASILNTMPQARLLLIAPRKKLAETAYDQAAGIVRFTPQVDKLFAVRDHEKTISHLNPRCPSEIKIMAADTDVVTGSKASYVLIDETHEFGLKPRAAAVFLELRGGLSKPGNKGFLMQITTQSKAAPAGVFRDELMNARAVRDGAKIQPMLPVLYELPAELVEEGGWKKPATWGLVNPNLNVSVAEEFLRGELEKAEEAGPEALALTASQYFNVEIGTAQWGDGWAAVRHWDGARQAAAPHGDGLAHILQTSDVCTIGVDGGGEDDLCGLAVIGRHCDSGVWQVWSQAWAQPEVLVRRKAIATALQDFSADGDLVICAEPFQHVAEVVEVCARVQAAGLLPDKGGIGLDQAGLPELFDALIKAGMDQPLVEGVPQGWQLMSAIRSLPLRLKAGRLQHYGQPMLGWAVGNAKVEQVGNNLKLTKQLAGAAKIDPVIAMLNAAMLMFKNPDAGSGTYSHTGF